ncbi:MAG: DnaA N-terminal domain-containing protein, partial [Pseudomonadota bacterium]
MTWERCLDYLKIEIPQQEFNTWLRPLQSDVSNNVLTLYAPNKFVVDWVNKKYLTFINDFFRDSNSNFDSVLIKVGSLKTKASIQP